MGLTLAATALLTTAAASVSATGILLPLYVYPSAAYNDAAANWQPALAAISSSSSSSVPWLAVVNPGNGPGATGLPGNGDANYISGVSQLNAHPHVQTIGYVRTDYGASPQAELQSQHHDLGPPGPRTLFYGICDVVVVFESFLNNPDAPAYQGQATIDANTPAGHGAQAAVIVHDFVGTAADGRVADTALLGSYVREAEEAGLGWLYFCSGDYDSITTAPATVGALAAAF
ncbi:Spherulation-specific family 4-domain-containing protein [Xylaria cf. heliscus]|nr:Spherulation-specific family 4-domain-containing protein [Xylaria cf. heliscus]